MLQSVTAINQPTQLICQ